MSSTSAMVVGGSGGIGLAVARGCAADGLGITLVGRRQDRLERAGATIGNDVHVLTMAIDAGQRPEIERAVEAHEQAHGGLDLVVVAAGGGRPGRAVDTSEEDLAQAFERDLHVPWQVLRASIGALRETARRNGVARYVVVGSVAGLAPVPGFAAYSAAKAALRSLVLTVEDDEADAGVRATVVEPGYVATPLTESIAVPADEMLRADDVAHAIRFLLRLSHQASVPELVLGRVGAGRYEP